MSKFKVGDKVQILCNDDSQFDIGTIGIIKSNDGSGHREWEVDFNGTSECFDGDEIELTTPKLTKNQRITALEKEVAELKVIVHQLRQPSTDVQEALANVENIIEFEGKRYKKVNREAKVGDVVIVNGSNSNPRYITHGKCYKVINNRFHESSVIDDMGDSIPVYLQCVNRTPETVDVYELFSMSFDDLEDAPIKKSPNQLRAEIIEKAKSFIDENGGDDYHFDIDENEGTVFAYKVVIPRVGRYFVKQGFSKCHPNDVFNADIGKVISFGRAEKLDVSEFENAVQPTDFVKGQLVKYANSELLEVDHVRENEISEKAVYFAGGTWMPAYELAIINDTNAIYGGGE